MHASFLWRCPHCDHEQWGSAEIATEMESVPVILKCQRMPGKDPCPVVLARVSVEVRVELFTLSPVAAEYQPWLAETKATYTVGPENEIFPI